MENSERFIQPSFSELIDKLTIDQIKQVLLTEKENYADEMQKIEHDLDLWLKQKKIVIDSSFIRLIVALAQINLHIWKTKEVMQTTPDRFQDSMKLAHQLNGIRNQIKNILMQKSCKDKYIIRKTNTETDNLEGWKFSIIEECG